MKKILFSLLLLFSVNSYAGSWIEGAKIKTVIVQPNSAVYIIIDKTVPNLSCPLYNKSILQLDTNAPNYESQFSMILTGYTTGKLFDIYANGCGSAYAYAQNTAIY